MKPNKTANYTLTFGEKILYGLLFSVAYLFSLLPMRLLYFISDILLYPLVYKIIGYRVKLVRQNLTDSFPDKSQAEIQDIERRFYHYFGDLIMEIIKGVSISKKEMMRRMDFRNMEKVYQVGDTSQSIVIYLGHYCNWEWVTSIGLHLNKHSQGAQIYHILENRVMDKFMLYVRSRMGTINIPIVDILRYTIDYHRRGQCLACGYISDQVPFWNNIHYWTDFLHHDTPVLTGAETICKKFDQYAIYLDIQRVRRGYYQIDIIELAEHTKDIPDYQLTEKYFRLLERSIQRQPEFWLWTHNRWKRTRKEWEEKQKGSEK